MSVAFVLDCAPRRLPTKPGFLQLSLQGLQLLLLCDSNDAGFVIFCRFNQEKKKAARLHARPTSRVQNQRTYANRGAQNNHHQKLLPRNAVFCALLGLGYSARRF